MEGMIGLVTIAGMATLVVAPPLVLRRRHGARWRWFALGIASWIAALGAKAVATALLAAAAGALPASVTAAASGLLSACTELGAAAVFLRRRQTAGDVLAFGAGVGCFEILFKVALGVAWADGPDSPGGDAAASAVLPLVSLAEHASTVAGHVSTRVLVHLTCVHRRVLPGAVALTTFALVDGAAAYGWAAGWPWTSLEVYAPFVAFLVAVACVEVASARYFWRRLQGCGRSGPGPAA